MATYTELPKAGNLRAQARLAAIARNDTYSGGARALVLANRLQAIGSNAADWGAIVADVYTGNGRERLACSCPECGCSHLGESAALQCCRPCDDSEEIF